MAYPTRGLHLSVKYPEDLNIHLTVFGIDDNDAEKVPDRRGLSMLRYNSWLLPNTGFAFNFYPGMLDAKADAEAAAAAQRPRTSDSEPEPETNVLLR
jgi:hypothetical protein